MNHEMMFRQMHFLGVYKGTSNIILLDMLRWILVEY